MSTVFYMRYMYSMYHMNYMYCMYLMYCKYWMYCMYCKTLTYSMYYAYSLVLTGFNVAGQKLGQTKLLDAEDIYVDQPGDLIK